MNRRPRQPLKRNRPDAEGRVLIMSDLTPRQKAFVREYLVDLNAKQAAIRAGYSAKSAQEQSSRLLSHAKVSEYVREKMEARAKRVELRADDVLEELRKVAFSRITDYVKFGPTGIVLKSSDDMPDDATACVQMVSETVTKDGGTVNFKLHNKVDALKTLLQHLAPPGDTLLLKGENIKVLLNIDTDAV